MKKFVALVMALIMVVAMTACGSSETASEATADTIKVGIIGPHTGDYAVYGLAVRNGAELYFNQLNANGGINGKEVELVIYDQKGDSTEAVNALYRMVDEGVSVLLGDVLTGNTLALVPETYSMNMPQVTASATAAAVTVAEDGTHYTNVFRTCFIDPFQGEKMGQYAADVLGVKTAAVIVETGNDYSQGLYEKFAEVCEAKGVEIVATEAYSTGDKDFKAQLTNISAANPDVIFCPNYYQDNGLIITQAREIGITATFLGGDGWDGVTGYATAEDLEGCLYCSGYAPHSTDAVIAFEDAYTAAYGSDTLNMFAATSYDAAAVIANALKVVDDQGITDTSSDEFKQAVIDAIRDNSGDVTDAITSDGYEFDENNNPVKQAAIITVKDGTPTFVENY